MKWFLLFLLGGTGAAIILTCIVLLLVRHRLRRHHRVDPSVPTGAPASWMVDPREPARLHRRLCRIGRTAATVGDHHRPRGRRGRKTEPSPLLRLADDLRDHAVALDRQLARLHALAPADRRGPLADLAASVAEAEEAAVRLVAIDAELVAPRVLGADDPTLGDLTGRLDRLAAAHRELLALDRDAGLDAEPLPAPPLTEPRQSGPRPQGGAIAGPQGSR